MLLALRITLCSVGVALLFLGLFVYEDEERNIQSRLQNWWISLDDQSRRAISRERNLVARLTASASIVLDGVFGHRLLTFRALSISAVLSTDVAYLGLLITSFDRARAREPSLLLVFLNLAIALLWFLARFVTLGPAKERIIDALFFAMMGFGLTLGMIIPDPYMSMARSRDVSNWHLHFYVCELAMILSTISDFLLIALFRKLLRRASALRSGLATFAIVAAVLFIALLVCYVPYRTSLARTTPWMRDLSHVVTYLNASDGIVLFCAFCGLLLLLSRHLLWPVLLRPLYALQRMGILSNKKAACTFGFALISSGAAVGTKHLDPVWEALKKIVAG